MLTCRPRSRNNSARTSEFRILGACNPSYAYQALQAEDKVGVFLPCNFIVEEWEDDAVEITAVDPIASMGAVKNDALAVIAQEIQAKLKRVVAGLGE